MKASAVRLQCSGRAREGLDIYWITRDQLNNDECMRGYLILWYGNVWVENSAHADRILCNRLLLSTTSAEVEGLDKSKSTKKIQKKQRYF